MTILPDLLPFVYHNQNTMVNLNYWDHSKSVVTVVFIKINKTSTVKPWLFFINVFYNGENIILNYVDIIIKGSASRLIMLCIFSVPYHVKHKGPFSNVVLGCTYSGHTHNGRPPSAGVYNKGFRKQAIRVREKTGHMAIMIT